MQERARVTTIRCTRRRAPAVNERRSDGDGGGQDGGTAVELVTNDLDHIEKVGGLFGTAEVGPLQVVELLDETRV